MITVLRLSLVVPFLIFIHDIIVYDCTNLFSLVIFVSIIVSDIVDGRLARKLNCATITGARLDIISDAVYSISSLALFVYFKIIPVWFPVITVIKLLEFVITSRIMGTRYRTRARLFFDKTGKLAVNLVMLMPGMFVFRCVLPDYKTLMNITVYLSTALFILSFCSRVFFVLRTVKTKG